MQAAVPDFPQEQNVAAFIEVSSYKRLSNTTAHCAYTYCRNKANLHIPKTIKVYLWCHYNLNVPENASTCREHILGNAWNELEDSCNVTHNFNSAQFSDVCNMLTKAVRLGKRLDLRVL